MLLPSFQGHLASKFCKLSSASDFVMRFPLEHADAGLASGKIGRELKPSLIFALCLS